ncbi:MAG: hypothetical protein RH942_17105 [Kiloniellaceae bacterium]
MVPEVDKWGSKLLSFGSVWSLGLFLAAVSGAQTPERSLTRVVYEFAVAGLCGTQDREVVAGYHREVAAITARGGYDEETARQHRLRGWVEADEEWSNRGLGGNRAWCQSEGLAAARHFKAIARGQLAP